MAGSSISEESAFAKTRAWVDEHNLALVDALRPIAEEKGATVAQLAIAWVLSRGDDR